jgi:hypothetical protein
VSSGLLQAFTSILKTQSSLQCRPRLAREPEARAVVRHWLAGQRRCCSQNVVLPINQAPKPQSGRLIKACWTTCHTQSTNGFVSPVPRNRGGLCQLGDSETLDEGIYRFHCEKLKHSSMADFLGHTLKACSGGGGTKDGGRVADYVGLASIRFPTLDLALGTILYLFLIGARSARSIHVSRL